MEKRRIGSLEVSVVGLGCNNFGWRIDAAAHRRGGGRRARRRHQLLRHGRHLRRHARARSSSARSLGGRRDDVVIATKFGMQVDEQRKGGRSPSTCAARLEDSLRRLGTDRIDLYQLHQPDPETPIADTLGALDELVRAGKVREIGCSNFSAEQLREAEAAADGGGARFVSVQNEYSLLHREPERPGSWPSASGRASRSSPTSRSRAAC